jgi:hypothetical protein
MQRFEGGVGVEDDDEDERDGSGDEVDVGTTPATTSGEPEE